jgi:hypothetical protein
MDLIDKYLGEAKIPKVKGKGKYNFGIKNDPEGWYQKPEMMGHRWAKESLDRLENVLNTYSKTKLQKWIIDVVFGTPSEINKTKHEWHYFANNITKKDVANLQFALRRVDSSVKDGMYALLSSIEKKSGMLKSRLNWALETLAYKYDKDNYLKWYMTAYGMLGMEPKEAMDRFERYHKGISKKIEGQAKAIGSF